MFKFKSNLDFKEDTLFIKRNVNLLKKKNCKPVGLIDLVIRTKTSVTSLCVLFQPMNFGSSRFCSNSIR